MSHTSTMSSTSSTKGRQSRSSWVPASPMNMSVDMRTAIAYALAWPERIDAGVSALDLVRLARLDFEAPDLDTFRCLRLAYQALAAGGQATIALNAANEEAVAAFLDGRLSFLGIAETIERCLALAGTEPASDLAMILDADLTARRHAQRMIATLSA